MLDTNTIVSAILAPRGIPNRILEAARSQQFVLATSSAIITEVLTTLSRERIRRKYRIEPEDLRRLRDLLEREAVLFPAGVGPGLLPGQQEEAVVGPAYSGAEAILSPDPGQFLGEG